MREYKGLVENLVGYVKSDLMIPEELSVADLVGATEGRVWCTEVNGQLHSEIAAIPAERLEIERPLLGELPALRARIGQVALRKVDRLSCVRFGSARYSVPTAHIGRTVELRVADGVVIMAVFLGEIVAEHRLVAPGETAICDDHYGEERARARPGGAAQDSSGEGVCGARAGGRTSSSSRRRSTTLAADLAELCAMEAAHGRTALVAAISAPSSSGVSGLTTCVPSSPRAPACPRPRQPVDALIVDLPAVAVRSLGDYAVGPSHRHDPSRTPR